MKILLAVDGSDVSTRAAKHVVWLARQLSAAPKITLFNADMPLLMSVAAKLGNEAVVEYHADNARQMLQPARRVLTRAKLAFVEDARVGEIAESIIKAATERRADLIVMGSRGSGAFRGMFLGSVSTKVIAESPIPVTIIR